MSYSGSAACVVFYSDMPPLISVVGYCRVDAEKLDVQRFHGMKLHGDSLELRERSSASSDTAVGAWIQRWKHWGRSGVVECATLSSETDLHYKCSFEEAVYKCKLSE